MELEEFERVHGILLASAGLPSSLYSQLHAKLSGDVFDGGNFFEIETLQEEEERQQQRRLVLSAESLKKESQVFLVDHAWSFRLPDARKQLESIPGLAERMGALMCVSGQSEAAIDDSVADSQEKAGKLNFTIEEAKSKAKQKGGDVLWLELDDLDIDDAQLQSLNLSATFPNLVGLSLWGNKLESLDVLVGVVGGLSSLRALWLNKTPVEIKLGETMKEALLQVLPHLEIYNSQFTRNYTKWAVGFCAGICDSENPLEPMLASQPLKHISELDLSDRNMQKLSTEVFNSKQLPFLTTLNLKGNPLEDDSTTSLVQILKLLMSLQSLQVSIPGPLGNSAQKIVEGMPKLQSLNGVSVAVILDQEKEVLDSDLKRRFPVWSPEEPLVDRVMRAMWHYLMTYRLADEEKLDETPIWYMMDELGSALRHSDAPNFRVAPFMYLPDGTLNSAISYSLLWPIQDVKKGEECTRDYLVGLGEDKQRSARLTAWFHTPKDYFIQALRVYRGRLKKVDVKRPELTSGSPTRSAARADKRPLAVYSDIPFVSDFLRRPEFVLVDETKEADIIWTSNQIDDDVIRTVGIQEHQYINQFPFESCLVMKHYLAQTMQQAYGSAPWLPQTYDMETQLAVLIGDYLERESLHQNNLWIVKPWNMARTLDTTVTSSLPELIRLVETGPKIAQKYIDPPALFQGRKFDLRYIVLLRSLQPLEIFLSDVFWARFSDNQYTTEESSLSEYETHFTVMNYRGKVNHINTHDFVPAFEKEHNVNWKDIHEKVKSTLRQVFEGAASVHPEMHSPRGRAIYGVDIMLDNEFQPNLLEVTYCPDCGRACKYDVRNVVGDGTLMLGKDFVNCVFGTLFLNEEKNMQRL
ncbi:unnamed protein product [Calypogeia fissa]